MVNGVSREVPRDSIHHDTPSDFPHIVPVTAVAAHVDPAVVVELMGSVEEVLYAMLTTSHSNSHSHTC